MRTNNPTKQDIKGLIEWAVNQQQIMQNDALACYTFRNLAYRLQSVLDYVPDNIEQTTTRLGKPILHVVDGDS